MIASGGSIPLEIRIEIRVIFERIYVCERRAGFIELTDTILQVLRHLPVFNEIYIPRQVYLPESI